jgi:hypothetical protein
MGQYYHGIILAPKVKKQVEKVVNWVYSHDIKTTWKRDDGTKISIGNGLKLMEHSYRRNNFVNAFETLIADNPQRVVWAGDYADNEPDQKITVKEEKELNGVKYLVDVEEEVNLYSLCDDSTKIIPKARRKEYRFVINHTKKCYVDKRKVPKFNDGWQLHPLPILTCEGNGRGGGDFRGESSLIGLWARDLISVSDAEPIGYEKFIFDLIED